MGIAKGMPNAPHISAPSTAPDSSHNGLAKTLFAGAPLNTFQLLCRSLERLVTSATLVVTSALLVVTRTLVETSATLVVTSALLVVTRSY